MVAGRPAARDHLVGPAAAAEIAGPARPAGLLPVHVTLGEPVRLAVAIDACSKRAHGALRVADEAVAGREGAVGGDARIPRAGAAGIGPGGAATDPAQRIPPVGSR